jgi:hypothetical protein
MLGSSILGSGRWSQSLNPSTTIQKQCPPPCSCIPWLLVCFGDVWLATIWSFIGNV